MANNNPPASGRIYTIDEHHETIKSIPSSLWKEIKRTEFPFTYQREKIHEGILCSLNNRDGETEKKVLRSFVDVHFAFIQPPRERNWFCLISCGAFDEWVYGTSRYVGRMDMKFMLHSIQALKSGSELMLRHVDLFPTATVCFMWHNLRSPVQQVRTNIFNFWKWARKEVTTFRIP